MSTLVIELIEQHIIDLQDEYDNVDVVDASTGALSYRLKGQPSMTNPTQPIRLPAGAPEFVALPAGALQPGDRFVAKEGVLVVANVERRFEACGAHVVIWFEDDSSIDRHVLDGVLVVKP